MSCDSNFKNFYTKQKGLVFLFVLLLIVTYQNIFAAEPCGKLLGGFSDDCIIIRGKERQRLKPKVDMLLYPGDMIIQERKLEKIIFSFSDNGQKIKIHPNAIWIDYTDQKEETKLPKFLRWLDILKAAEHLSKHADTKNINYDDINPKELYPKPGWKASLLPGESILFGWESRLAKSFVIVNAQKKVVFQKKIKSVTSIELNVNEIGIEPSLKYYWGIEVEGIVDIRTDYELQLLDSDIARIVKIDLEEIEKEESEAIQKKLKEAAYWQFISDIYGSDAGLYWKSGQILAEIDRDELEDKQNIRLYQVLLLNYRDHHNNN